MGVLGKTSNIIENWKRVIIRENFNQQTRILNENRSCDQKVLNETLYVKFETRG
jgi:hypothetical protein